MIMYQLMLDKVSKGAKIGNRDLTKTKVIDQ